MDFKAAVENGDYLAGSLVFEVPLQIGSLLFDTPKDPDTGQIQFNVTNMETGTTVTILAVD